jgi:hypothetical protein
MTSRKCEQCKHFIIAKAGEGKIYGCDRSKCVFEPTTKNDLVTLTFSKGTLKYSCKDYVVYKKDWLRSHYGAEIDIMFGDSQYKEPTTKNDLGVDCIDRKAIEKHIEDGLNSGKYGHDAVNIMTEIHFMPSVTPQDPRKGHWIKGYTFPDGAYWKCDKCNELIKVKFPMNYCNNCGADMREVEE